MDWRFSFFLISMLLAMAFGWQLALFFPPGQYQVAGYVLCGGGVLVCLVGAAKK